MNSFIYFFCLPGKFFNSPSILNDNLPGYQTPSCRFLCYSTLNISCQSLLASKIVVEKSVDSLKEFSLGCNLLFSCCCLQDCLFIPNFCYFNYNKSWCWPLWAHRVWNTLCFLDLDVCFHPQIRKVFNHIFSNILYALSLLVGPL